MADRAAQITRLIQKSDQLPWGRECGAVLGEAITLADAAGEEQLAYAARMRLIGNAQVLDDGELVLATFAVCEEAHRRDPLRFPANPGDMKLRGLDYVFSDLNWMWKWIPSLLMSNPRFTREDIEASLAGMTEAYAKAGISSRAVPQRHLLWALQRGDLAAVRHWRDDATTLPDDEYSDCEACSRDDLIDAAFRLGEVDRGMAILQEIIDGGFECVEQPAIALSRCLAPLARRGDADGVRRGVAEILDNLDHVSANLGAAGRLVAFLTQVGQPERALVMARRALPLMADQSINAAGHLSLLTALTITCTELVAQGKGEWPMPQCDEPRLKQWFGSDRDHTVASVAEVSRAQAERLAEAFDTRDRSDWSTRELERHLTEGAHERFTIDLDLPPDPAAAFMASDGDPSLLFRIGDTPAPVPTDAADALRIATQLCRGGRMEETTDLLRVWLPRLEDAPARAGGVHRLGVALAHGPQRGEVDPAALTADLVVALEPLGWPEAIRVFTDLGLIAFDPTAVDTPGATALVDAWQAAGLSREAVGLGASFLLEDLDPADPRLPELGDAGRAAWLRLGSHPAWPAPRWAAVRARVHAASAGERTAGVNPALPFLDEALAEEPEGVDATHLWAWRAAATTDPQEAADHALAAFRVGAPWSGVEQRAGLTARLLAACSLAGRTSEVIATSAHLRQLAPALAPSRAVDMITLALQGLSAAGQGSLAADTASEALDLLSLVDPPNPGQAATVHDLVATTLRGVPHEADALEHLLTAADLFAEAGDPLSAADAAARAGFLHLGRANAHQAGRLAETILEILADHPHAWREHLRARHLLALAAVRLPEAPREAVEQALQDALALAAQPPTEADTELAAGVTTELTEAQTRWLRNQTPRKES